MRVPNSKGMRKYKKIKQSQLQEIIMYLMLSIALN
jgi:hypothetical protein